MQSIILSPTLLIIAKLTNQPINTYMNSVITLDLNRSDKIIIQPQYKQMSYVSINQLDSGSDFIQRTQRIYIDPEELMAIKNKRKTFKMVKSIYQPDEEVDEYDQQQWGSTVKSSFNVEHHVRNLSSPKLLSNKEAYHDQMNLHQHMQTLRKLIDNDNIAPNVQFIWKLLPPSIKKQVVSYQQGDCIPLASSKQKADDKFLILSGQIKIIGKNQNSFKRKAGFLYFLSSQTKDKIKQIVVLRSTKILRIPYQIYETVVKSYMSIKLAQRQNFIRMCPFFIWNEQLSQDLASCMQEIIYHSNHFADRIYFVKQGIVLLQRNSAVKNSLVQGYERHYEKTEVNEKDVILVVRKGMVFGIDGVIIKEFDQEQLATEQVGQSKTPDTEDIPQPKQKSTQTHKAAQPSQRSNYRIYSARTLGKCQLYCLDKKVLQTMSDINKNFLTRRTQINSQQLRRLSLQYMSMLTDPHTPDLNHIPLKRKQIVFNLGDSFKQRSKSLASIEQKSTTYIRIGKKSVENASKSIVMLLNKKKVVAQNIQQQIEQQAGKQYQKEEYQRYSLKEEKEVNQLRNRIKQQRQRLRLQSIKKSPVKNQPNNNPLNVIKQLHHFPKIFLKKQFTSTILNPKPSNQLQKKLKLDSIINKKLKQDIKVYNNPPNHLQSKIETISIEKRVQRSQLVKLLEQQNIKNKSNPSFINVKSYKSIGSVVKLGSEI